MLLTNIHSTYSQLNLFFFLGTQLEQIPFIGNGIRVLEMKREVLARKEISGGLDFDLKIIEQGSNRGE